MLKEYFTVSEILNLKIDGYIDRRSLEVKASNNNWLFRLVNKPNSTKPVREYHLSNFPSAVRTKIVEKLLEQHKTLAQQKQLEDSSTTAQARQKSSKLRQAELTTNKQAIVLSSSTTANQETIAKSITLAYARFELIDFIKVNKLTKHEFIKKYNKKQLPLTTYDLIPSIKPRTLYIWIKTYNTQGIEGLRNKNNERRKGKVKSQEVKELVYGALLKAPHLNCSIIYKFINTKAQQEGFKVPTIRTIINWVNDFKNNNKSAYLLAKNPDSYKGKYMLALGSYSEEASSPNYIWELDSTPADVMTLEGRVVIIGCIDVFTRRVKFLTQKTSNSLGITNILRQCILDWGVPKIIKTDNGKDYTSNQIKIVLDKLNIEHRLCNPFSGWEKPHIERVFGSLQHGFITAMDSYIGHNVAKRKDIEAVKSFATRMFDKEVVVKTTIAQLQAFLNWWSGTYYLAQKHEGLAKYIKKHELEIEPTPAAALEYAKEQGFTARLPDNIRILDLLLEPLAGLRIIGKKGIRVENANYFNPNLAVAVGEEVYVRVDRFDMGKIYVFDRAHNFLTEAVNYELLGENKLAFIAKSKQVQKEANKEFKKKAKRLISKTKDIQGYIGVDLQEVEQKVSNANANIKDKKVITKIDESQSRQREDNQEEAEEAKANARFNAAKELEEKIAAGENVTAKEKKGISRIPRKRRIQR